MISSGDNEKKKKDWSYRGWEDKKESLSDTREGNYVIAVTSWER